MQTIKASDVRRNWSQVLSGVAIQRQHVGVERTSAVQAVLVDTEWYRRACELMDRDDADFGNTRVA